MSGSAFRQQVRVFADRNLTPEAQSQRLAAAARAGRDELIRSGRAAPHYATWVDGRRDASEDTVKPGGAIVYRFQLLGEAAAFAMAFLRGRAPVKSGTYRDGFAYAMSAGGDGTASRYIGSRIVRRESFDPQRVGADVDEVILFNREPYSRKVDVQLVGQRRLRFEVPAGLFDDAATAVRRRFPTLTARRVYTMNFPNQWILKTGQRAGKPVESPALVIGRR
ncbi:hypothetical protein HMPREF9946_02164 [Acetobacteraceae bacterium AT-5844]|nr:hypothetical protein HMPREF9946_02164 [Acetobacteraceae bacterium AT-5844]